MFILYADTLYIKIEIRYFYTFSVIRDEFNSFGYIFSIYILSFVHFLAESLILFMKSSGIGKAGLFPDTVHEHIEGLVHIGGF